ncbi:hypothetical protein [Hymenobacter chitinivorans]|uniref:TonB-dependent SusC/RagA subfamily outer membrane receptor n=1 Tax=Hymenobacter chitinivorans DSM 11115 TaxID=1121954 RepID=A0A2M9BR18_9BACT|nr:hypothetical protein [Hymenobacter chitinivorans]PJJ60401.1 TonB-dependent SusC/RagA subfamily outer membrane receptor [Hymenobacter chitinivorans DSM 11115]
MRYFLLFPLAGLLTGNLPALGQTHPVPRAPDNPAWMDSVRHLALPQQVAAVRARRDTLLAPLQPAVCWMPAAATGQRPAASPALPAHATPLGIPLLYVVNGKPFVNNDPATMGELQRVLGSRPIRQVAFLHDAAATAIYGTRGATGVVVLSSEKPKRH